MTAATYVLGIVSSLLVLVVVVELLRRRRLRERHAIWWLVAGTVALVISVFPSTLSWAAALIGVEVPTNLVFFVSIAILFLVCLQYGAEITRLEERSRTLAEEVSLLDMRVRDLESARADDKRGEPHE